jgi:hypothetical protein
MSQCHCTSQKENVFAQSTDARGYSQARVLAYSKVGDPHGGFKWVCFGHYATTRIGEVNVIIPLTGDHKEQRLHHLPVPGNSALSSIMYLRCDSFYI